jgi:hypothetical protein
VIKNGKETTGLRRGESQRSSQNDEILDSEKRKKPQKYPDPSIGYSAFRRKMRMKMKKKQNRKNNRSIRHR